MRLHRNVTFFHIVITACPRLKGLGLLCRPHSEERPIPHTADTFSPLSLPAEIITHSNCKMANHSAPVCRKSVL
jgi:hypothetical protein